jgi:uracil-DNA glycosylase family 4
MRQGSLFSGIEIEQEDVVAVMKEILVRCENCRLCLLHPANKGMCYRGNVQAELAVLYEAPRDGETERGNALAGHTGKEFENWAKWLQLDTRKDVFVTTVIQCQPEKVKKNDVMQQREPEDAEIRACFGPRALRVLRAMPNLKCVITLGWPAAKALVGGEPKAKTHEAQWFETSLLPGIPVFCMPDPSWVYTKPSAERSASIQRDLEYFRREYMRQDKMSTLAATAKEAREAEGLGLL